MLNITINGQTIEVPEGITVLRAAEMAGVPIPKLCDHPALPPYGGCRLCVVEVQGFRTPIASCTLPVSPNMVVETETEKLKEIRKFILTMLFSERNHFCPYCQKTGGDCELQNAAYEQEMTHWPISPGFLPFPVDASHPYFVFDHNRCILCRRCVRACASLVGNFTLDVENRGANTIVVGDYGLPMGESSCIRCGTCVQVCPTGALIDRNSAYQGLESDAVQVNTVCVACSVGCGITLLVRDNRIIRILGKWDAPLNQGVICGLGRYQQAEEVRSRLTRPMVRKNGNLAPTTWEEALDTVSQKVKSSLNQNGDGIAALVSSRLPAESLYAFKQLFHNGLNSRVVAGLEEGFTSAKLSNSGLLGSLEDLKNADCVLVLGADLVKSHQVAGFFVKRNRPKGISIILVDPNENQTESVAHYSLKPKPASDLPLVKGISAGLLNLGFGKNRDARGDQDFLNQVSNQTGIAVETILAVSRELGMAKNPVIVFGKGITRYADEVIPGLEELALILEAKLINVVGKANSVALQDYSLDFSFDKITQPVLFLVLGDDFPTPRLIDRVKETPFMVLQASYESPLLEYADVVLPSEIWAEQSGHYINLDRRVQAFNPALERPSTVWSSLAVIENLADKLGVKMNNNWRDDLVEMEIEHE